MQQRSDQNLEKINISILFAFCFPPPCSLLLAATGPFRNSQRVHLVELSCAQISQADRGNKLLGDRVKQTERFVERLHKITSASCVEDY